MFRRITDTRWFPTKKEAEQYAKQALGKAWRSWCSIKPTGYHEKAGWTVHIYEPAQQAVTNLDWTKAEKYLQQVESAYASIGSPGYWALTYVIRPLRDRYNAGERTEDLYNAIMGIEL